MKDLLSGLLGAANPHDFFHAFIWAMVGATISLLMQTNNRNPSSRKSPVHFSWKFMLLDNAKRMLTALMLIVIFLRFMPDLIGVEISGITAFGVGFGNDKLAQLLKKTRLIGGAKDKA